MQTERDGFCAGVCSSPFPSSPQRSGAGCSTLSSARLSSQNKSWSAHQGHTGKGEPEEPKGSHHVPTPGAKVLRTPGARRTRPQPGSGATAKVRACRLAQNDVCLGVERPDSSQGPGRGPVTQSRGPADAPKANKRRRIWSEITTAQCDFAKPHVSASGSGRDTSEMVLGEERLFRSSAISRLAHKSLACADLSVMRSKSVVSPDDPNLA